MKIAYNKKKLRFKKLAWKHHGEIIDINGTRLKRATFSSSTKLSF